MSTLTKLASSDQDQYPGPVVPPDSAPGAGAWVGSVLFVLGGGIAYLMMHTITADDVAPEIPPELKNAELPRLAPRP
jgi:hypothetical protein